MSYTRAVCGCRTPGARPGLFSRLLRRSGGPSPIAVFAIALFALLIALLGAGCSAGTPVVDDAGLMRPDATFVDATLLDGGRPEYDASPDASAPPDAAVPACSTETCDPQSGGGCEAGYCSLRGSDPSCEGAIGEVREGARCTTTADCGLGLACFQSSMEGIGICARVCCPGDDSSCGTESRCGGDGVLLDGERTEWGRCMPRRSCDVLDPTSCGERDACYVVSDTGETECRVAGEGDLGSSCTRQEDCAPTLFCGGLGVRTCQQICGLEDPIQCMDGARCIAQAFSPAGTGVCVSGAASRGF